MAMDRNIAEMKALFQDLASKQDDPSTISCFEFVKGLQQTDKFKDCSTDDLKEIFFDVAADGCIGKQDYMITEEEFINAMKLKDPKCTQDADLKACFSKFDEDGSGSISPGELREKLENEGWNFNDEQFERLVSDADKNDDGSINFEEFRKAFRAQ